MERTEFGHALFNPYVVYLSMRRTVLAREAASRRSIRCEIIEGDFENLLLTLKPTQDLFARASDMFRDLWGMRVSASKSEGITLRREQTDIERKVGIAEKIRNCGRPARNFDATFRTAFEFLANSYNLWPSDRLEDPARC